ncbi:MAG TPA: hypothetical protein PLY72_17240 [Candidatus Obscuribacter sp.]|nr:hypothetical protein [Candidatus Obscuribacter sp.]HNG76220.1 hypothetical protein [Candidatus Obscuribacter sp.]
MKPAINPMVFAVFVRLLLLPRGKLVNGSNGIVPWSLSAHMKRILKYALVALAWLGLIASTMLIIWLCRPQCPKCHAKDEVKAAYHSVSTWFGCPSGADMLDGFVVGPLILRQTTMFRPEPYTMPKPEYDAALALSRKVSIGWTCKRCKNDLVVQPLN